MNNTTKFANEQSLTELFVHSVCDSIPRTNGHTNQLIIHEFDCNRGRADIVYAIFQNETTDFHKANIRSVALSQPTRAFILSWLIRSSPCTEAYIQSTTGLSKGTIRKHLRILIELGIAEKESTGLLKLGEMFELPEIEIWAFEVNPATTVYDIGGSVFNHEKGLVSRGKPCLHRAIASDSERRVYPPLTPALSPQGARERFPETSKAARSAWFQPANVPSPPEGEGLGEGENMAFSLS